MKSRLLEWLAAFTLTWLRGLRCRERGASLLGASVLTNRSRKRDGRERRTQARAVLTRLEAKSSAPVIEMLPLRPEQSGNGDAVRIWAHFCVH